MILNINPLARNPFPNSSPQARLCELFGSRFHELLFTIHPFGSENEIPGKCSNANCGIRTALAHVRRRDGDADFDADRTLVTTCDADSKFHPRYLEALSYREGRSKGRWARNGLGSGVELCQFSCS